MRITKKYYAVQRDAMNTTTDTCTHRIVKINKFHKIYTYVRTCNCTCLSDRFIFSSSRKKYIINNYNTLQNIAQYYVFKSQQHYDDVSS